MDPLWSALRAVLSRRGCTLELTAGGAPLPGELARVSWAPEQAAVVTTSRPCSALEQELVRELVRDVVEAATAKDAAHPTAPADDDTPERAASTGQFHELIGRAPQMLELYRLIDRVAPSEGTSVLIQGENGTGKELVARAIHQRSPRRDQRFVIINCSAFNDNLLDSELFGHKRGAFTGASADRPGLFEVADRGTFFLDEIGDMSPSLQAKVLRLLQDGTYYRVGDTEGRRADVRILAATHRDLAAMVQSGEFREDLYYRINVVNVVVPPLRARREDVPLLVERFLRRLHGGAHLSLAPGCLRRMLDYPWPGNVRELENEVERLVVLAGEVGELEPELLTPRIRDCAVRNAPANPESLPEAVEALERQMIAAALHKHRGNKSRAAQTLQVSRRNLIRLVQKYGLEAGD